MDDEQKRKMYAAQKLHEKARHFRGRFLNTVAVIEHDIAVILTEYFCTTDEEKRELFFNNVAEKLSLEKKKNILIEIVKKDYPRYWEENKDFLNNIHEVQRFRNKLAHSVVDVSNEALSRSIEDGVGFIQWKKGAPLTDENFQEFEVKAGMISSILSDIRRLLPVIEIRIDEENNRKSN